MGPTGWRLFSRKQRKELTQVEMAALIVLDSYGYQEGYTKSFKEYLQEVILWLVDIKKEISDEELEAVFYELLEKEFLERCHPLQQRVTIVGKIALTSCRNYPQALRSWEIFLSGGVPALEEQIKNLPGRLEFLDGRIWRYCNW